MWGSVFVMRRAATLSRMISIHTNTGIVIIREGKLVHISETELLTSEEWTDIKHGEDI
jgi:hypothetical protein